MLVGFLGDIHGRIFLALAAAAMWQQQSGRLFELLLQVGDMGAYPDLNRVDPATDTYLALDPTEADFSRLIHADGKRAAALHWLRTQFATPIYFIRGNHEDFTWLSQLQIEPATGTAPVDAFDLVHYVPDGSVQRFGDLQIAFLGGEETTTTDPGAIDQSAYTRLMNHRPGTIDVLITHDAPYGVSIGYHGQVQGSEMITTLIEHLQPAFHIAGHYELNGPRAYGRTTFLCLSHLVASVRWQPEARGVQPGSLAILDTAAGQLWPVADPWLSQFDSPFDFDAWIATQRVQVG
jgi:Calcineurin-like phosphoesterase